MTKKCPGHAKFERLTRPGTYNSEANSRYVYWYKNIMRICEVSQTKCLRVDFVSVKWNFVSTKAWLSIFALLNSRSESNSNGVRTRKLRISFATNPKRSLPVSGQLEDNDCVVVIQVLVLLFTTALYNYTVLGHNCTIVWFVRFKMSCLIQL